VHPPCVRGIGRLALLSHTFSLPACETGHNLKEIFATPSLPEDAADHGAILQHAEIVLVWTNRRALEDDQRRQPGPRGLMAKTWSIQTIQKRWEATSARNRRRVAS
jgi:hypothetical protein